MDASERRLQRAAQVAENGEKGAAWEGLIEQTMMDKLQYNYETQQLFGGRKPDFAVYNDDGEQMAFVEGKSHQVANQHDIDQTVEAIAQAQQYPGCEMVVVTPNGREFFGKEVEHIEQIAEQAKVPLHVVDFAQWEHIADRFQGAAVTQVAPEVAATPATTPTLAPVLPPVGSLNPHGRG
jgi:hypothetical protein